MCIAVFFIVQAIYFFSGEDTYRGLVLPETPPSISTGSASGGTLSISREMLPILHRQTLAYVLGGSDALPNAPDGSRLYDRDETAHLADVRHVFDLARIAWIVAAVVGALLVARAWRRRAAGVLVRDASMAAGIVVVAIAAVFAVAFEPAFLAFHYVFFPQGDFLFDPATSHLLLVYPERYWYGVILRVGLSFVAGALAVWLVAWIASRERSAIVPPAMGSPSR